MKKAPHGMRGAFRCEVVTSYARGRDQNGTVKRIPWKHIEKAMMAPIVAGRRIFMLLNLILRVKKGGEKWPRLSTHGENAQSFSRETFLKFIP
jgi:hypothetical protein